MKNFVIYLPSGQITRTGACQEETIDLQTEPGELLLEAVATGKDMFVDNGALVEMPQSPGEHYSFDYATKSWLPDLALASSRALSMRDQLLATGPDRVNPMWWASMTPAEQGDVSSYRQALLDITNQFGYPMDIEWPAIPSVFKG